MTTAPLTVDDLRCDVAAVVAAHGWTMDEFLAADVDDLDDDELRDLWLMTEGILHRV